MSSIKKNENILMRFSVDDDFDNDKFLKLRLKICHNDKSLHNTRFTLEALKNARSTIANIPILAHIYEGDDGNLTIGAHDTTIEEDRLNEEGNKEIYLEQPVGLVPESNNYEIVSEDGVSYVYCDGYVWKGYSNYCADLLERYDKVGLSMEVEFNDFDYSQDEKCYIINDFKYLGITLLGEDETPAMQGTGAAIVHYSVPKNKIVSFDVIKEQAEKLILTENEKEEKGEDNMTKENIEAILNEKGVSEGELPFEITEEMTKDELEAKIDEYLSSKEESEDNAKKKKGCYDAKTKTVTFSLSYEEKADAIYRALAEKFEDYCPYYPIQTYDDCIIVCNWDEDKLYKFEFTKNGDEVEIGESVEVFGIFVTADEREQFEAMKENYAELEKENGELKDYKEQSEAQAKENAAAEVFEKFDDELSDNEDYAALKEDHSDMSAEQIEEKCFAIIGKLKSEYSAKTHSVKVSFSVPENNEETPYGGLVEYYANK